MEKRICLIGALSILPVGGVGRLRLLDGFAPSDGLFQSQNISDLGDFLSKGCDQSMI